MNRIYKRGDEYKELDLIKNELINNKLIDQISIIGLSDEFESEDLLELSLFNLSNIEKIELCGNPISNCKISIIRK